MLDILDRERSITRTYPDRSFDCPFCSYAVVVPALRCANPWCSASEAAMTNPGSRAAFQAQVDKAEREQAEQAQRRRSHEQAMERIREEQHARIEREQAVREQAIHGGKCVRCALHSLAHGSRVVYTKHRGACPRVSAVHA